MSLNQTRGRMAFFALGVAFTLGVQLIGIVTVGAFDFGTRVEPTDAAAGTVDKIQPIQEPQVVFPASQWPAEPPAEPKWDADVPEEDLKMLKEEPSKMTPFKTQGGII